MVRGREGRMADASITELCAITAEQYFLLISDRF
jgi:hypothetical protein